MGKYQIAQVILCAILIDRKCREVGMSNLEWSVNVNCKSANLLWCFMCGTDTSLFESTGSVGQYLNWAILCNISYNV